VEELDILDGDDPISNTHAAYDCIQDAINGMKSFFVVQAGALAEVNTKDDMKTEQQVRDGYQQAISEVEQALKTNCQIVKKTKSEAGRTTFIIERLAKIGKPLTGQHKQYRHVDLTGVVDWQVTVSIFDATHMGREWEYIYGFGYGNTSAFSGASLEELISYLGKNGFTKAAATKDTLASINVEVTDGKIRKSDVDKAVSFLADREASASLMGWRVGETLETDGKKFTLKSLDGISYVGYRLGCIGTVYSHSDDSDRDIDMGLVDYLMKNGTKA
jgi:hypothetical protein